VDIVNNDCKTAFGRFCHFWNEEGPQEKKYILPANTKQYNAAEIGALYKGALLSGVTCVTGVTALKIVAFFGNTGEMSGVTCVTSLLYNINKCSTVP
jgi:hypothetical protein